jgi:single-strand DNA-binding protein
MLRVSLLGNMGGEPELRYTAKGTGIVSFSVAVNQVRTGADGERQENTEWFRIKVTGRQSEFVQRLSKGTRVLVIGRLDISHFVGKDGQQRTGFDVWADDVQAMSRANLGAGGDPFGIESSEAETAEPALAGVSGSAGSAGSAGARASTNGKGTRAPSRADAAPSQSSTAEDLEDLPF